MKSHLSIQALLPHRRARAQLTQRVMLLACALAAMGSLSCSDDEPLGTVASAIQESALGYSQACTTQRLISKTPCGSSTVLGSEWSCSSLFSSADLAALQTWLATPSTGATAFGKQASLTYIADLKNYTVYEWNGPGAPNPATPPWGFELDCPVVPAAPAQYWAQAHQAFSQTVGAVTAGLPACSDKSESCPADPVWLGIIDDRIDQHTFATLSSPAVNMNANGDPLGPLHGMMLGQLIGEHTWTAFGGIADIHYFQALDHEVQNGALAPISPSSLAGTFGYQTGLLRETLAAFVEAVDTGQRNAIFNLSVGYEDRVPHESPHHATRALEDVITLAHCFTGGGVVYGSAMGNSTGSSGSGGPLYPAAFARVNVPQGCLPAAGASESSSIKGLDHPLVYAIGAVDAAKRPIAISRPQSRARIMAAGAWGAADPPLSSLAGQPKVQQVYTGTSVATAVVSALAAMVWYYHPTWTGAEVMAAIYKAGEPLGIPADVCLASSKVNGVCPMSRLVTFCDVIHETISGAISCHQNAISMASFWPIQSTVTTSGGSPVPLNSLTLPSDQWLAATGSLRVEPQPVVDACPNCILDVTGGNWNVILPARTMTFNQLVLVSGSHAWTLIGGGGALGSSIGTQAATIQVTGTSASPASAYLSYDFPSASALHNSGISQLLVVHQ